jgi:predicted ribosomally synthesized peptide with nif11-like leader
MSKENLDQFIQQISESEELQARIGEEIDADSLIALGAEHGCEFSAEDLTAGAELSDEELDGVAGGLAVQSANGDFRIVRGLNSSADDAAGFRIGRGLNSSADDAAGIRRGVQSANVD